MSESGASKAMRFVVLPLLVACGDTGPVDEVVDAASDDAGQLSGPDLLRLPAIEVDETAPTGELVLASTGPTGALTLAVSGPFEVTGSLDALDSDTTRMLEVTFIGSTTQPGNHSGTLLVTQADQVLTIALAAAVLAPALPTSVAWTDDGYGRSAFVAMPSAPFPTSGGSWTDPTVWIWVPHGLSSPFATVTHLHGHNAVVADMLRASSKRVDCQ
jgi:hypothetical protein